MNTTTRSGRFAWGLALLLYGGSLTRAAGADDGRTLDGARILGARHVAESLLLGRHGRLLAAVDVTHAASMLALAAGDAHRRRAALTSAAASAVLATTTLAGSASARR